MLSRIQFGATAAFHIIFPMMSIGLALYLFVMECMWLKTGKQEYYQQLRFWLKIFTLSFAIGVASGIPMAFQFGMSWAAFSNAAGSFFGNIIGFETTIAFTLETASLGIMIFGWKYVSRTVHLIANGLTFFAATLSAFWIIAANSWMQIPEGTHMDLVTGKIIVDNYWQAIFNSGTMTSYLHTLLAAVTATLFLVAGVSAWAILRENKTREKVQFFINSIKYAIVVALIAAPVQVIFGDILGVIVAKHQPAKFAAMELHYDTNAQGQGAPWSLFALPNKDNNGTSFAWPSIPNALSIVTTKTMTGEVKGLNDFATNEKPTAIESALTYYSSRIMILIGFAMVAIALVALYYWRRGKLEVDTIENHKGFLRFFVWMIPLGFIAVEMGWMAREIGRQPYMIYHNLTIAQSLSSNLNAGIIIFLIVAIVAIYIALFSLLVHFIRRITEKGPDFNATI